MRITQINPQLKFCTEGSYRAFRSPTSPFRGLSVEPKACYKRVVGQTIHFSVTTGGPESTHFVAPGGHTPLQVQAVVAWSDGETTVCELAIHYAFGDRSHKVSGTDQAIGGVLCDLVQLVATANSEIVEAEVARVSNAKERKDAARIASLNLTAVHDLYDRLIAASDAAGNPLYPIEQELADLLSPVITDIRARLGAATPDPASAHSTVSV